MTPRLLPLLALLGLNTFAQAAPIHDDARQGNLPAVRALLQQDPKQVNAVTSDRMVMTPLHFAAQFGQVEMVKFLLAQGADVHARDGNRATPLFRAALRGQTACAELLIRAGADVNAEGNENIRPLHLAAMMGHTDTVKLLLAHGARTDVKDSTGTTPWEFAPTPALKDLLKIAGPDTPRP